MRRLLPFPHCPAMTSCPQQVGSSGRAKSLSISATSEVSQISASIIYNLDLALPLATDQQLVPPPPSRTSLISPSVTDNLTQVISTPQPEAREVLSSVLEGCRSSAAFCNDLFLDCRVEPCCETEEHRDAILHHLLNGMCILRPDVPS